MRRGYRDMFRFLRLIPSDPAAGVQWMPSAVVTTSSNKSRFLLWVDAVGGFFVCQGTELRLGQAVPESTVELPLLADLSRHHATIRRDEEGYTIEPVRDVKLDGRLIDGTSWISGGSVIQLGG